MAHAQRDLASRARRKVAWLTHGASYLLWKRRYRVPVDGFHWSAGDLEALPIEDAEPADRVAGGLHAEPALAGLPDELLRRDPELPRLLTLLTELGADTYPHTVDTLRDHLIGTWRVLMSWGQPLALCRAGLFHSVFSTEGFAKPLLRASDRQRLRDAIGDAAAQLVFLFCTLDRAKLGRDMSELDALPNEGVTVRNHRDGEEGFLERALLARIGVLSMANMADFSATLWLKRPVPWMSKAGGIGKLIAGVADVKTPPVFDDCTRPLPRADDCAAIEAYDRGRTLAFLHRPEGERLLARAAELNPWAPEPRLWLARCARRAGRRADGREHAAAAVELLRAWGVSWDKRHRWDASLAEAEGLANS